MSHQCQICNASLVGQRSDARFCSAKCRSRAYNNRSGQSGHVENVATVPNVHTVQGVQNVQVVQSNPIVPPRPVVEGHRTEQRTTGTELVANQQPPNEPLHRLLLADLQDLRTKESTLVATIEKMTVRLADGPKDIRRLNERLNTTLAERNAIEERLSLSDPELFDKFLNVKLQKAVDENRTYLEYYKVKTWTRDPNKIYSPKDQALLQSTRDEWTAQVAVLDRSIKSYRDSIADLTSDMETLPRTIQLVSDQLREIRSTKSKLYAMMKPHTPTTVTRLADSTPTVQPARRPKQSTDMTAEDLRNAYFETFTLPTELGRFLGQLDRNKLAFALTGDSGAGKSHFAFEIAKLFSDEGYRTKIFCLEEGIGQLTQDKVNKYDLSNDVVITGTASLSDVRKAASQFDLIVLDSFGKLDVDAAEFENLRTDFPQTVFVIIFQKTATGSIRGGASIIFNSAATIDITKDGHNRIATMVKGRYGTQGWKYSMNDRSITAS